MKRFPLFISLDQANTLVVGGGLVALRKVQLLLKATKKIQLVAEKFHPELEKLIKENNLKFFKKKFSQHYLKDHFILIVAATDNQHVNKLLYKYAIQNNILINVVDQPKLCTCTFGSIVERGDITVAITSSGSAPVYARMLREKFEKLIPSSMARVVALASDYRDKVSKKFKNDLRSRRIFWENFFEAAESFKNKSLKALKIDLDQRLRNKKLKQKGQVFLVGSGPGDPELLTIRALQVMQKADVCIYDNLVSREIKNLVRRDAEFIYAGKLRSKHTIQQGDINKLLIKYALQGKTVVRLKGGDPLVFGRGGEEIEELMSNNISFQIIPGITSANGIAAYSGIPLTHRDYAKSVLFITGHETKGTPSHDWQKIVAQEQTLVVYMGLTNIEFITQSLISAGMSKSTPAAIVQDGTTDKQKVIVGLVSNIARKSQINNIESPALIVIGGVVALRKKMKWFN